MKLNRKNLFLASTAVITVTLSTPAAHAASGTWNVDAFDNWSTASNWSPVAVPGTTAGDIIGLNNNITANTTVTIDTTSRTAGILNLGDSDDTHAFTLTASGGATLNLNNSGSGAQINKTGNITDTISAPITLAENLAVNTAGFLQISGDISGSGTLTKLGGNDTVLTLSGNNSYNGETFLTGGQIIASHANALSGANVTINGGRRLLIDAGLNVANNITISSANGQAGRGVLESRGNGTATLSGNISITGGFVAGGLFASTSGNDLVLSGVITSPLAISQRDGTVTYSGGGTGYGNFSVTGTAKVGAENGIATTGNLTIGASATGFLDLNGFNQTLVGITKGANAATIGSSSTTANSVLTTTGTSTYAGTIVDVIPSSGGNKTLALTVASGALTLSGANTYTGVTTISGGTLALGNVNALGANSTTGTSAISLAAGTALQASTAAGNNTFVFAPITLSGAGNTTLRMGAGAGGNTTTLTLNGAIGGTTNNLVFTTTTGSFSNGSSVFVLGAAGNYTGNTLISSGNGENPVFVNAGTGVVNALPVTTVLTFANVTGGGTGRTFQYDMNGNNQTLAGLTNGGVMPNLRRQLFTNGGAPATLTINNTADMSFGGSSANATGGSICRAQITGAIALTKSGTGTFTLGGPLVGNVTAGGNTFTGDTKVLGGTLVLGETLSLQNSAFDTTSSIAGNSTAGLLTTVTALNLGGLSGNKDFANVFTTALGGPTNATPRGGYDGLTALTLNLGTGVTRSYTGNISNGAGNMTLTKTGTGTQILTGTNTYTGGTTLTSGTLQFNNRVSMPATGAVAVGNATTLAVNVGGPGEWTTGTSGNGTIGGLLGGLGGQGSAVSYTGNLTLGLDTTNASPTTQTYAGGIANVGTSLALTKLGANTLTLSGLSATAASNYSGITTINEGTLAFTTTNPSLTGGLTFGSAATVTTPGILDLTSVNATFAGALSVNSNSSANEIKIGPSQTLAIGTSGIGDHRIGAVTPAVTATVTSLNMTGGGTLNVTGATFAVAASSSSTLSQTATLDLTALKATTINLTGNFRVSPNTTQNIGGQGTLLLPTPVVADTVATTSITTTAGTFTVGGGGSFTSSFMNTLQLGTGLTTLNADTINVASGGRDLGQIVYGQAAGDLIIRAGNGTGRAPLINVGATNGATGSFGPVIRMDLAGHDADILVTTLNLGNQARTSTQAYEFNFGAGDGSLASKLDATNVNIGFYPSASSNNSTRTSKMNLSGGTVIFGDGTGTGVDIGSSLYVNAGTAPLIGELNISNGNVTINNGTGGFAVRLGSNQVAGGGTVTASMNLTGGTTTLGGDIIRGIVSPRTTSTVKISGGTLNMGGNDIGTATELITLTAESGTLQNVATINGTGGLTKTTAGTLVVSGTTTYTGDTTVSEGILRQSSANTANNASTVTIATTGATLDLTYTGTDTVDKLFIGGVQQPAGVYGPTATPLAQITNSSGNGTLTVISNPPPGFAGWITGTFINGTVPALQQGPNADFDNDGISNLVEYAIAGQDPTVGNPTVGSFNGTLLSFSKRLDATGLTYAIQDSTDLGLANAWAPVGSYTENTASTISYTLTPGTPPKNFLRLQVLDN